MPITDPPPGCFIHHVPIGQYCFQCTPAVFYPSQAAFFAAPASPGWQCPACRHVMAPFMTMCPRCPMPAGPESGQDPQVTLALPPEMAHEGYNRIVKLGAGFTEVLPGLEAAIFWPPDDAGEITAHFRLTPKDGQEPEAS